MGVAGQINLAQVAFFGVGAYATAILTTQAGLGFWTAAVLAVLAAPADRAAGRHPGAARSSPTTSASSRLGPGPGVHQLGHQRADRRRRRGHLRRSRPPTCPGVDLSSEYLYYYLELIVFALALAFGLFVVHTPLGRRMRAMRDDSLAAGASGPRCRCCG